MTDQGQAESLVGGFEHAIEDAYRSLYATNPTFRANTNVLVRLMARLVVTAAEDAIEAQRQVEEQLRVARLGWEPQHWSLADLGVEDDAVSALADIQETAEGTTNDGDDPG
ncbi:MAG TPA: hypothetical protein VHH13_09110 [Arthrobacter sp.]|nr:hypothetical protein [Arthrobacter sp.]